MALAKPERVNKRWKEVRLCALDRQFLRFEVNRRLSRARGPGVFALLIAVWLFEHR